MTGLKIGKSWVLVLIMLSIDCENELGSRIIPSYYFWGISGLLDGDYLLRMRVIARFVFQ